MSTFSWYETIEGKMAICLALLLLVLAVLIGRANIRLQADPQSDAKTSVSAQAFEAKRANNLAELPPLSPIDAPKPLDSSESGQAAEPKPGSTQSPDETLSPQSLRTQAKPKKRSSFFTFWLP